MILAKGPALPIAREGALKIKETTYIHAETFTSGEMKHGPIALINADKNEETKGFSFFSLILKNSDFFIFFMNFYKMF